MKKKNGIMTLETQQEFVDTVMGNRSIIYLLVDWSGQERASRSVIYEILGDLDEDGTPVFQIDCADETNQYVLDWLIEQQNNKKDFGYDGYGETLLVQRGEIIDYIKYPAKLGLEKTKEKLTDWKYSR